MRSKKMRKRIIPLCVLALVVLPAFSVIATENVCPSNSEENHQGSKVEHQLKVKNSIPINLNPVSEAPHALSISGPTTGRVGRSYDFTVTCTDPQDDDVLYKISWGDCSIMYWNGPFKSGEEITYTHAWCPVCCPGGGEFTIVVEAMDINGNICTIPKTFEVTMEASGRYLVQSYMNTLLHVIETFMQRFYE
jgi:hypothetical protein